MKKVMAAAICVMAVGEPAWAQQATAVGTGIAASRADSKSTAVAVSGQGGTGVGTGGNPIANVTIQGTQIPTSTTQTINNQGTSTVKNVPSVFSPGLAAAGLETCLGSVSGGGSFVGTGFSFGSTIPDPGCAARLDARTLWSMGLKKAAIARLCLGTDIYRAMPEICATYLPQTQPVGYAPAAYAQAETSQSEAYSGGPIMLVEGKTGRDRLCKDYDAPKQKCRHWDGEVSPKHLAMKKGKTTVAASAAPETTTAAPAVTSEGK